VRKSQILASTSSSVFYPSAHNRIFRGDCLFCYLLNLTPLASRPTDNRLCLGERPPFLVRPHRHNQINGSSMSNTCSKFISFGSHARGGTVVSATQNQFLRTLDYGCGSFTKEPLGHLLSPREEESATNLLKRCSTWTSTTLGGAVRTTKASRRRDPGRACARLVVRPRDGVSLR